jgi:N-methylhydantoinase B/oxoprolinase/acetone carboxylase alpha subunit
MDQGDQFWICQSGGGGYGEPKRRPAALVLADVRDGLVSIERARDHYGVVIDPKALRIDEAATQTLRGR